MNTRRILFVAAVVAIVALMLAACSGGAPATPAALDVTIHAKDISYDTTTITAKPGQTVNVTMINDGALDHTFVIDGIVTEQKAAAGQTLTFSFTAPAAGTYSYYCDVPGHKQAGMVGTLTVVPQ